MNEDTLNSEGGLFKGESRLGFVGLSIVEFVVAGLDAAGIT